ncbi:hypothetical protein V2J09_017599 [Rumex salicifolius]
MSISYFRINIPRLGNRNRSTLRIRKCVTSELRLPYSANVKDSPGTVTQPISRNTFRVLSESSLLYNSAICRKYDKILTRVRTIEHFSPKGLPRDDTS